MWDWNSNCLTAMKLRIVGWGSLTTNIQVIGIYKFNVTKTWHTSSYNLSYKKNNKQLWGRLLLCMTKTPDMIFLWKSGYSRVFWLSTPNGFHFCWSLFPDSSYQKQQTKCQWPLAANEVDISWWKRVFMAPVTNVITIQTSCALIQPLKVHFQKNNTLTTLGFSFL